MADYVFEVPADWDGATMQSFLRQHCGLSWRMVVKLKRVEGGMTADGVPLRSIDRLRAGQTVRVQMPEDTVRIEGADLPLTVVYEDAHVLVIDKPPYLAVHPSAGKPEPTLANAVVGYFEQQGTPLSFRPVNRLDRGTSGLMAVARHAHAYQLLQSQLHTPNFVREYLAVVEGELAGEGRIDLPIAKEDAATVRRVVDMERGKPAVTHFRVISSGSDRTLVRLRLETGRTHQIRVHMAAIGHPVVGDFLYGHELVALPGRFALHSAAIELDQPLTGERIHIESPLPNELKVLLTQ